VIGESLPLEIELCSWSPSYPDVLLNAGDDKTKISLLRTNALVAGSVKRGSRLEGPLLLVG
jgi:hypothetical protein